MTLPSPPPMHLNSPSISSPMPPSIELPHPPQQQPLKSVSRPAKDLSARDMSKNKFALALVDQAVKLLCEIWQSQDIPSVFVSYSKSGSIHREFAEQNVCFQRHNSQLHSSLSPSPLRKSTIHSASTCINDNHASKNLLPMKGFVHEVLRRSRTSGCVLQTALCYLDALRPKIPELVRKEKAGETGGKESELTDRIIIPADADLQEQPEEGLCLDNIIHTDRCSSTDPMPSTQVTVGSDPGFSDFPLVAGASDCVGVPTPSQPESFPSTADRLSPLLCPRRSFLAALILASKFLQDKSYSNRAWAKLSGLSPKEIGRCERALGEALDWRLWVGKLPVPSQPTPAPVSRSLHRTQSEGCLQTERSPFLVRNETVLSHTGSNRSLRRSSTLPASAYASDYNATSTVSDVVHTIPVPLPTIVALIDTKDDTPGSQSSTPSLVYSPTSTDSSSGGDRSAQQELDDMCMDLTDQPNHITTFLPSIVQNMLTPFSVAEQTVINPYTRKGGADAPDVIVAPTSSVDNLSAITGHQGEYLRRQEEQFRNFGVQ
ncbi:hypothetical protein APHAL10511_003724 [Amanita phalloides]|nr:hypothetical protein APHAL10511_003724 [Amanita phalloides]